MLYSSIQKGCEGEGENTLLRGSSPSFSGSGNFLIFFLYSHQVHDAPCKYLMYVSKFNKFPGK